MHLQILDLDGSPQSQSSLRDAAPWSSVTTVNLRDLGPKVRLWSRDETMRRVRERLPARDEPTLSLLGSGDFHHVAVLLMETSTTPMTIIHLDNHPDWVRLAPRWHCGSWINQALRLPSVAKVITLGTCSDDLVKPGAKGQCAGVGVGEDRPFSVESRALTALPSNSRRCGSPLRSRFLDLAQSCRNRS